MDDLDEEIADFWIYQQMNGEKNDTGSGGGSGCLAATIQILFWLFVISLFFR